MDIATTQRMTPSNVPDKRQEMKPLPVRIAKLQYERLTDTRQRTGISVQEHIRRAIDLYLYQVERELVEIRPGVPQGGPTTPAKPKSTRPRVQKR